MGLFKEAMERIAAKNREVTSVQLRILGVSLFMALAAGYTLGLETTLGIFGVITIFVVVIGWSVKSEYEHEQIREGTEEAWGKVIRNIYDNDK